MTNHDPNTSQAEQILDSIVEEALRIRYAWGNYRFLFVETQERLDVLNATAPDFFHWIQGLNANDVFMGIARLTDNSKVAGKPTASIAQLLDSTGWRASDPTRWQKYSAALTSVIETCKSCRTYRHKRLGHFDLSIALEVLPTPAVTVREVDEALDAIESFINSIHMELRPGHSQSFRFMNADDHTGRLMKRLTNRASQRKPGAVSSIIRDGVEDAGCRLQCGFCGESAVVWMMSDDIPDSRYLKHWHFDACSGLIGTETVVVEMVDASGATKRATFALLDVN